MPGILPLNNPEPNRLRQTPFFVSIKAAIPCNFPKGIMQAFIITKLYPGKQSGLFAKAGGGYMSNWSNRSDEPNRKGGWGLTVVSRYLVFWQILAETH